MTQERNIRTMKQNRKLLADLIYSKETFTEKELVEEFRELTGGDIVIDGSQTVGQFLEQLRNIGAIIKRQDTFFVNVQ